MNRHDILIVEDNLVFAIKVERHLVEWGHKVIGIVDNSADTLASIKNNRPSIILMDISLKGATSGIELAREIKELKIPIIFITGLRDLESFKAAKESNAIQYLVKPFDMLTLKAAIEFSPILSENKDEDKEFIFIRKRKELIKVPFRQIDFIQSDGNYCDVFCGKEKHTMKVSMKKLMLKLELNNFLRIHKSYAVRKDAVSGVLLTNNQLRVGEHLLPIGRKYRTALLRELNLE